MSEFDNIKINEELNKINILNTKELIDNYNEKVISEERIEEKKKSILANKRYLNNQKQIEEKNNIKKLHNNKIKKNIVISETEEQKGKDYGI